MVPVQKRVTISAPYLAMLAIEFGLNSKAYMQAIKLIVAFFEAFCVANIRRKKANLFESFAQLDSLSGIIIHNFAHLPFVSCHNGSKTNDVTT